MEKEGVVKFKLDHSKGDPIDFNTLRELNIWRRILYKIGLIGCYNDGISYGNISQRLDLDSEEGRKKFAITGTQTGRLENLTEYNYVCVLEYYPEQNRVVSNGPIGASSESMTHGTIYDLEDSLRFVFHGHSPDIWVRSNKLQIPSTKESVEYGTPKMADEVRRLFSETNVSDLGIFSMGGHENGIISFGKTSEEAGNRMINYYARSFYF